MKKFYITLAMLLMCILAIAQDKTVTIVTDNTEAMFVQDPDTYTSMQWEQDSKSVQLTISSYVYSVQCRANSGYKIVSAKKQDGTELVSEPGSYVYLYSESLSDGDVITCTTAEKEPKVFVCKADPSMVYLDMNDKQLLAEDQIDGQWTVQMTDDSYLYIKAHPDHMITEAIDQDGNNRVYSPTTELSLSGYSMADGTTTYTVKAYNMNDARTDAFTLEIDGDPYKVVFRRQGIYQDVPVTESATEVRFNPATELPISISPASYGSNLYKVTLNGENVAPQGSSWQVSPINGDIVKVYTEFPDIQVPVKFSFVNEGTEDAIRVSVNNEEIPAEQWLAADFTVKLGSTLGISFNSNKYNVTLTENGSNIYAYGSYAVTLVNENGYEFGVTAEKLPTYTVTLTCNEPSQLEGYFGYGTANPIAITATTNVLEVSQKSNSIRLVPSPTGIIKNVTTSTGETFSNYDEINIYVNADMTIDITTEEFVRANKGVLYLAKGPGNEDNGWTYSSFTLSQNKPQQIQITPVVGYNFFDYSEYDMPFNIGLYPDENAGIYLNDVQIFKQQYGAAYPDLENFQNGDVIKIYPAPVEPLTVTNEVQDGLEVEFITDYFRTHDVNAESVSVLPGTRYTIRIRTENADVNVLVDNQAAEPDDEGNYNADINADTKVVISRRSAIGTVGTDTVKKCKDVYNMQGILVKSAASQADIESLPAGLYIIDGRKVAIR